MHIHLLDYLKNSELLHPFQSGFRCKHSSNTAPARFTHSWLTAMNKSEVIGVVFLILKKAFDLLDHNILLTKFTSYLQNSSFVPFFKSYVENKTQRVLLHGSYSSEGSVQFGVPQGSVLGPVLFNIFLLTIFHCTFKLNLLIVTCRQMIQHTIRTIWKGFFVSLMHPAGLF